MLSDALAKRGFAVREVGDGPGAMAALGRDLKTSSGNGASHAGDFASVVIVEPDILPDAKRLGASIRRYYPEICLWRYADEASPELGWFDAPSGRRPNAGERIDKIGELVGGVVEVPSTSESDEAADSKDTEHEDDDDGETPDGGAASRVLSDAEKGSEKSVKETLAESEKLDSVRSAAILTEEELAMLLEDNDAKEPSER
ncbi:MAG: hypothetical protein ACYTGQ_09575 [Planctomycetota bacterium]